MALSDPTSAASFPRFDAVNDDSDHHYVNINKNAACFASASSGVHKKIMNEWKILEKNLPESIFVRVYERRIDLLRAVIVGAAGTPYHDGLFFFDIAFPADYPARPPMVQYHSFGYRINPNLYDSGKVCLSLINTWTGKKAEKWDPNGSTILQLLLSIQALVLNEKPYFNEPGTNAAWSRRLLEKRSNSYNEDVFRINCRKMIILLRRPPKNFEVFVKLHFRDRARSILSACEAYVNGRAKIGFYRSEEKSESESESHSVSENFKKMMKALYPELWTQFSGTGSDLGNYVEPVLVKGVKKTTSEEQGKGKKKSGGGALWKLLKVLGMKKLVS